MKHLIIAFTLMSGTLLAQSGPAPEPRTAASPASGPSYSQMYCSGFVTRDSIPRANFVVGSKESPHQDRFAGRSTLFLGGPALVEGQRYSLLRQVQDPNREDSSPEQRKKFAKLGALYQEIGWVTVHSVQKDASVASFDFACDTAGPGDIVVPYQEKPSISFRSADGPVKPFRDASSAPKGHILAAKDFVGLLGNGQVVYTDFGTTKGIKPGDYLLVVRGYAPGDLNRIDRASERLPRGSEVTAVNPATIKPETDARLPQHILGEILILSATADSSTAIITRAFAEMELGDVVRQEDK
ncbi:MAG TPA: hypothetical protein VM578_04150 [Candidatus Saccharimonadales bacterium]|nr:hypothetical protein [Candidatus Saccharimonadales bacterium]